MHDVRLSHVEMIFVNNWDVNKWDVNKCMTHLFDVFH